MDSYKSTITLPKFIKKYLVKHRAVYISIFIVVFIGELFGIIDPYIIKNIVDVATENLQKTADNLLFLWIFAFVLSRILAYSFWRVAGYMAADVVPKTQKEIQENMHEYLYQHSVSYCHNNFAGSLAHRITHTASVFGSMFRTIAFDFYPALLNFILPIVALTISHFVFGIITTTWLVIFLTGFFFLAKKKSMYAELAADASSKVSGVITDGIANMAATKIFVGFWHEKKILGKLLNKEKTASSKSLKYSENINTLRSVSSILLLSLMSVATAYYWTLEKITAGDFVFIFGLTSLIVDSAHNVFYQMIDFFENIGSLTAGINAIYVPHEILDAESAKKLLVKNGEISIENASFCYANGGKVFDNFSMHINSCEKIALVGKSGAGKTSFVNLLLRFYDLNGGRIRIDGEDISKVQQESLRGYMAVVPQDPFLFHRSIMENIRYGNPKASDEKVVEAAKRAYADDFIETLPEKYDTIVGERGIKLSGGQRQRIAIARAILADRPILILDEATSSLDSESELYIQKALSELMKNRTVIAIAHRLSTIKQMDRILVLENGNVIEEGKHDELLIFKGAYSRLWDIQSGKIKDYFGKEN